MYETLWITPETTYQLVQDFVLPTVCYSMYSFLNWWCLLDLQYTSSPFIKLMRHQTSYRSCFFFVELLAGWFQHRDMSTLQLGVVSKERAKGAIFRFCWWWKWMYTCTVRENSGNHALTVWYNFPTTNMLSRPFLPFLFKMRWWYSVVFRKMGWVP